jgi:hypothetical protein
MTLLSFTEIKQLAVPKDYELIAELYDLEKDTIRKVVAEKRNDKHNIQEGFTILLNGKVDHLTEVKTRIRLLIQKAEVNISSDL